MHAILNMLIFIAIQWSPYWIMILILYLMAADLPKLAFPSIYIRRWDQTMLREIADPLLRSVKPLPPIRIDRQLLRRIKKRKNLEGDIQTLFVSLMSHTELPQGDVALNLYIHEDIFRPGQRVAGTYEQFPENKQINLIVDKHSTPWNLSAVLCHEIAHYYADIYGLSEINSYDNERRTDALTVFLGFSPYILRGYRITRFQFTDIVLNKKRTGMKKLGYIPVHELEYIRRYIAKQHQ